MSTRFLGRFCLVVLCGVASSSCERVCTTEGYAGISIEMLGEAATTAGRDAGITGCGVRIHATSPGYSDDFFCGGGSGDCYCGGAWERPGTYAVTVTVGGRVVDSRTVTVRNGDCHVQTVSYVVSLNRDAG